MDKIVQVNFDRIWKEEMGWNDRSQNLRKFDDQVEAEFWVQLAPQYTEHYNLNHHTPKIAKKLEQILGHNKSILEIGPGTGNFSVLMAVYSKEIYGVDFSDAMIHELRMRCEREHIPNVSVRQGKWEEFETERVFDFVVSVNSLYRIRDIWPCLQKINQVGGDHFVLVRSLERPRLHEIYRKVGIQREGCVDWQLMPLIFWRHGIQVSVDFVEYEVYQSYHTMKEVVDEMCHDLGETIYERYKSDLQDCFIKESTKNGTGYRYVIPCATAFIYRN